MKEPFVTLFSITLLPAIIIIGCSKVSNKRDSDSLIGASGAAGTPGAPGETGAPGTSNYTENIKTFHYLNSDTSTKESYLFIGAPSDGEGSLYKCDLNGNNCINRKTKSQSDNRTSYAASIYASNDFIYIGAPNVGHLDGSYQPGLGALIQCNLDMKDCFIPKVNKDLGDGLGSSVAVSNDYVYLGAPYANTSEEIKKREKKISSSITSYKDLIYNELDNVFKGSPIPQGNGVVYRCMKSNLNSCQTIEYPYSTYTKSEFGSSIFLTHQALFVVARSAVSKNNSNIKGVVFKCTLEGSDCTPIEIKANEEEKIDLKRGLFVTNENLYLGAFIRRGFSDYNYAVLKCSLNGENCKEIVAGSKEVQKTSRFGESIFIKDNNIYVGAPSYEKTIENEGRTSVGAIYKCQIDSDTCSLFKEGTKSEYFGGSIFIY